MAGEGCSSHTGAINDDFNNFDNTVYGDINPTPHSGFSVNPQSQYNCSCCQVLREITHTKGMNVKRLEIHGVFGVITHAVLGTYGFDPSFQGEAIQMFDFHNESTQMVKRFMVQYFETCKLEGYDLMQDPLSKFYEALCVGLNELDTPDDFLQLSPENTGDCPNSQQEPMLQREGGNIQVGFMKIPLAMQVSFVIFYRERTRKLRLKDFKDYYDLPIEDAAKRLNICPTVMKKICRKNGVVRWPYRKVKSIKKKISKKTKILNASDDHERARALADIQKHQQELATIYESFNK
ncbi:protein nlp2 [Phtheirospermum japonicum]|uniref:Protein nlp2 n=1 Tax=Phtheirospermum japonicum TaxID=374723 RepID=A0A830CQW6_9LAMI|nr:protein nlp2 [Phtheirospermum japonicum]